MTFRRIDWYGQLTVASLTIISVPFFLYRGFLAGLFLLGCWQLISAALNTSCFIREGYRSKILFYWKLNLSNVVMIFLFVLLWKYAGSAQVRLYFGIASIFFVIAIVYYFRICFLLIEHLSLNNELHGVIKSKH